MPKKKHVIVPKSNEALLADLKGLPRYTLPEEFAKKFSATGNKLSLIDVTEINYRRNQPNRDAHAKNFPTSDYKTAIQTLADTDMVWIVETNLQSKPWSAIIVDEELFRKKLDVTDNLKRAEELPKEIAKILNKYFYPHARKTTQTPAIKKAKISEFNSVSANLQKAPPAKIIVEEKGIEFTIQEFESKPEADNSKSSKATRKRKPPNSYNDFMVAFHNKKNDKSELDNFVESEKEEQNLNSDESYSEHNFDMSSEDDKSNKSSQSENNSGSESEKSISESESDGALSYAESDNLKSDESYSDGQDGSMSP